MGDTAGGLIRHIDTKKGIRRARTNGSENKGKQRKKPCLNDVWLDKLPINVETEYSHLCSFYHIH